MQVWDTTTQRTRDQFALWREVICEAFCALDPQRVSGRPPVAPFPGRVTLNAIDTLRCATVEAEPHRVLRGPPQIRRDPQEAFFVNLQRAGACAIRQEQREPVVRPGTFVVLDLTRPYEIDVRPDFSIICLRIPRERLLPWVRDAPRLPGLASRPDSAAGRVAAAYIQALWDASLHDAADARARAAPLTDILCELVGLALVHDDACSSSGAIAPAARAIIQRRLHDPRLSPATVARELRVSERTLHKAFEPTGASFSDHVRAARLARCAAELRDPASLRRISSVAWRWGFTDPAHFSRVFRQAYGMAPREWRRQGRAD